MKRGLRVLAAAGSLSLALLAADGAFAQKAGGILKLGHFDSPASMSMLEESTQAVNRPMSGVFNNLVMFKQDEPQNSLRSIVPDLALVMERGGDGVDLSIAPGGQMARWQALHRRRCQVYLRSLDGQRQGQAAHQSAQILVCKCGGCDHQRRLRSDCSFEAAATLLPRAAGDRLVAGLPLPCLAARHAPASDRHRPVPADRVQAESVDHCDAQP